MSYKVMVVDDTGLFRIQLKKILEKLEFVVVGEAIDGQDALDQYPKLRPDIILMDVQMPRMDGITALRHFRDLYPEVKIIIMTAFLTPEVEADAKELMAEAVLAKPLQAYILKDAIMAAANSALSELDDLF